MSNIKQDIFYNYDPNVLPQEVGKELILTSFSVCAMQVFKPNLPSNRREISEDRRKRTLSFIYID